MGGFIAQTVAIRHPESCPHPHVDHDVDRERARRPPEPAGRAAPRGRRAPAADRELAIEETLRIFRLIGSRGFPVDDDRLRAIAGASYDRGYDPAGYLRQLAAILAQPDRTAALRRLTVPTLVMHGLDDPLVSPTGGLAIARAIPRTKFIGFSGMGHDLPRPLWPAITNEILELTSAAPTAALRATSAAPA